MAAIPHSALFDFEAYANGIKEADNASKAFGDSMLAVITRIQVSQVTLLNTLNQYVSQLNNLNLAQAGAGDTLRSYGKNIADTKDGINELKLTEQGLVNVINLQTATIKDVRGEYAQLKKLYDNMVPASKDFAQNQAAIQARLKELIPTTQAYANTLRSAKQSVDASEGSYNKLSLELNTLRAQLRAMPGAFNPITGEINRNNAAALQMQTRVNQLSGTLKNADAAMGQYGRNVGNYSSAFSGMGRSILTTIGALVGIGSAFEGVSAIVNINKQLDSLDQKLKLVSTSELDFAKNQIFVRKAADAYGLSITDLTDNFARFYSATRNAGFSGDQTRAIYEKFAKAFGNLRLTTEQTNNAFVALDQVMSKGKLASEEIRKQLGNALPGAFELAAKSIGVTTSELNKMLKEGKIVSTEFLPKFADQLEKTFGKNDRVEGLQAAINRFQNSLKDLARSQVLTDFFASVADNAAAFVEVLANTHKGTEQLVEDFEAARGKFETQTDSITHLVTRMDELGLKTIKTADEQKEFNETLQALAAIVPGAVEGVDTYGRALGINTDKVEQFVVAQNKLLNGLRLSAKVEIDAETKNVTRQLDEIVKSIQAGVHEVYQAAGGIGAGAVKVKIPLIDKTGAATDEGKKLAQQQTDLVKQLMSLDQQAGRLNEKLPQEAENYLKVFGGVEYEKVRTIAKLRSDVTRVEKQITIEQIALLKADPLNDALRKNTQKTIDLLVINRDEMRKKIQELEDPSSVAAPAVDTTDAEGAAKKARDRFIQNIRAQEEDVKKALAESLSEQALLRAKNIITEEQYWMNRYNLTKAASEKLISLENKLSKVGAVDPGRLSEFRKMTIDAEKDLTVHLGELIAQREKAVHEAGKKMWDDQLQQQADAHRRMRTAEEHQGQEIFDIEQQWIQNQDALNEERYANETKRFGKTYTATKKYLQAQLDLYTGNAQKEADYQRQLDDLEASRKKDLYDREVQLAQDAGSAVLTIITDQVAAQTDARISALEEEKNRELNIAGTNAAAKERIEKDFAKREAQEKRKQARADKAAALFEVAINTAVAISKDLRTYGGAASIPFIAIDIAEGAIQAAVIAAKPLPQFYKGTKSAPKGRAIVGEKGAELMEQGGKFFISPSKPTIVNLKGGEKIYSHTESNKIIERAIKMRETHQIIQSGQVHEKVAHQMQHGEQKQKEHAMAVAVRGLLSPQQMEAIMLKTLGQMPQQHQSWDDRGYREFERRMNEQKNFLNKRMFGR